MQELMHFWNSLASIDQQLLLLALKASLLLALGFGAAYCLRRNSAALRHLAWTLLLGMLLLLPLLSLTVPSWPLAVLPSSASQQFAMAPLGPTGSVQQATTTSLSSQPVGESAGSSEGREGTTLQPVMPLLPGQLPASLSLDASRLLLAIWALGALLTLGRLLLACALLRRQLAQASPPARETWGALLEQARHRLDLKRPVRLRLGQPHQMPLVWGLLRPVVLLPAQADAWNEDERRTVLLHELAHIKRNDLLVQLLAHLACAVYWFNPLVWMAARALRREREQACDDLVLRCGTRASTYARQLLSLAQRMEGARLVTVASLAMSRPSELEGRLLSILNGRKNRGSAPPRVLLLLVGLTLAAAAPLAALKPVPQEAEASEPVSQSAQSSSQTAVTSGSATSAAVQAQSGAAASVSAGAKETTAVVSTPASASSRTQQSASPGDRSGNISLSEADGSRWTISMEGLVLEEDYGIKEIKAGGFLIIRARHQGRSQMLTIKPDGSGGLRRTYEVDGETIEDAEAEEDLLRRGLERIRRVDGSTRMASQRVEEAGLRVEEMQERLERVHESLRSAYQVRSQDIARVMEDVEAQMRRVHENLDLEQHQGQLARLQERLEDLSRDLPEKLAAAHESLERATLHGGDFADQHRQLMESLDSLSEHLDGQLRDALEEHETSLRHLEAVQGQLQEQLQGTMQSHMETLRESMDRLHREMDHLRMVVDEGRSKIESTLRQGLSAHSLGWDADELQRRLDDLVSDLLQEGSLHEEEGRFTFKASPDTVRALLTGALAQPLQRMDASGRAQLENTIERLTRQLSDLRW